MIYDKENQKVLYNSKQGAVFYDPIDWLAAITSHIPDKGTQNVHYYVYYSNRSRGLRKKALGKSLTDTITTESPPSKKVCRKKWAELIQKIYEISPLCCPKCHHEMKIIAFIEKSQTIQKVLKHLNLWQPQAHGPPMSEDNEIIQEIIYDYSFFDYLPS